MFCPGEVVAKANIRNQLATVMHAAPNRQVAGEMNDGVRCHVAQLVSLCRSFTISLGLSLVVYCSRGRPLPSVQKYA